MRTAGIQVVTRRLSSQFLTDDHMLVEAPSFPKRIRVLPAAEVDLTSRFR
jgi:hypothetical protein